MAYIKKERNYIIISNGKLSHHRHIRSVNKWFDNCEYFSFHLTDYELEIRKYYLEIPKFALKRTSQKSFIITNLDLPIGTFEINQEDSSEDILFIKIK